MVKEMIHHKECRDRKDKADVRKHLIQPPEASGRSASPQSGEGILEAPQGSDEPAPERLELHRGKVGERIQRSG